jgi:uncharacterized short protein YbdD (DUF466 family)
MRHARETGARPSIVHQASFPSLLRRGSRLRSALNDLWLGVREWCGDSAYDRYIQAQRKSSGEPLLTPAEFYVQRLNNRYSRPNRCC